MSIPFCNFFKKVFYPIFLALLTTKKLKTLLFLCKVLHSYSNYDIILLLRMKRDGKYPVYFKWQSILYRYHSKNYNHTDIRKNIA